jgi:thermostable 8-oxoguanine DNA glycosylase
MSNIVLFRQKKLRQLDNDGSNDTLTIKAKMLQSGLVTELEFNLRCSTSDGSQFETIQFRRAISDGILSLLDEELRNLIMDTYAELRIVNQEISRLLRMKSKSGVDYKEESRRFQSLRQPRRQVIAGTLDRLKEFISADR